VIITIDVTRDDIAMGLRGNGYFSRGYCPVALAIVRAVPSAPRFQVGPEALSLDGEVVPGTALPELVRRWNENFNRGGEGVPFTFSMRIPDELLASNALYLVRIPRTHMVRAVDG